MNSTRRKFLRNALGGTAGMYLASQLTDSRAADAADPTTRAKSCIVLWMNGGPSHVDTFDLKAHSRFSAIDTRAKGMQICEHLPQLAAHGDKLAIVRSLTSREGNHQRARFLAHTGYAPNPTVAYPALGSWVSAERAEGALPSFISVGGPAADAGFLGPGHAPFVMQSAGDPPSNTTHGDGVSRERFDRRFSALQHINTRFNARGEATKARDAVTARSLRMMRSAEIAAFELSEEPQSVRDAYGDTDFGRGCLLARRLVERDVPIVEVTLDGWDTHQNNFDRTETLMNTLDPAMATLLGDLQARNLLDSTLVLWMGEFGRTPRVNRNEGRDHFPRAWSAVLAGGGIRGGIVHGETDDEGGRVVRDSVSVPNLFATVAHQLGIAPDKTLLSPGGRPISVTERGAVIRPILA